MTIFKYLRQQKTIKFSRVIIKFCNIVILIQIMIKNQVLLNKFLLLIINYKLDRELEIIGLINLINFVTKIKTFKAVKLLVASSKSIYYKFVQIFVTYSLKIKIYKKNRFLRFNIRNPCWIVMNGFLVGI